MAEKERNLMKRLLEEDETFRFYYLTHAGAGGYEARMVTMGGRQWLANRTLVGYATSRDGLKWVKPELGLIEFDGSTANNLVLRGDMESNQTAV